MLGKLHLNLVADNMLAVIDSSITTLTKKDLLFISIACSMKMGNTIMAPDFLYTNATIS
jgi:hypothetical protein